MFKLCASLHLNLKTLQTEIEQFLQGQAPAAYSAARAHAAASSSEPIRKTGPPRAIISGRFLVRGGEVSVESGEKDAGWRLGQVFGA